MSTARYRTKKVRGRSHLEHRWLWEQENGPIPEGFQIHHKDGDGFNNDLSNLELVSTREHGEIHSIHPKVKSCAVCGGDFRPAPTKRERAKTCSRQCFRALLSDGATARHSGNVERDESIHADKQGGMLNSELADKYELSRPSITRILKKFDA